MRNIEIRRLLAYARKNKNNPKFANMVVSENIQEKLEKIAGAL